MKDIRVAKRYAAALFGVAVRDDILDAVAADLELIGRYLGEVPYLRAVLNQPLVSDARKNKVIVDAFGDRVTASSLNFLKLLIRKRREDLIPECIREFRVLLAEQSGTVDAEAWTAVPMTLDQQQGLVLSLHNLTGKKVRLRAAVDVSLVGGVVVRLGDTVIDGSVRGKLERLERQLLGLNALGGAA